MQRAALSLFVLFLVWAATMRPLAATARGHVREWHQIRTPAKGDARSIGGYSAGCVQGALALPLKGPGFQVMRPERRRHFGHPLLVQFVRGLGQSAKAKRLGLVQIGDLGQPRGGPAPTGHASHQSGLDVDIWYASPPLPVAALSPEERKAASSPSVVDEATLTLNANWQPRMAQLLRSAGEDERVARIFVNPVIKRALCQQTRGDRAFLAKLRPWWGHDEHFHVRLACPTDSPECEPQSPLSEGDGCAEAEAWLSPDAQREREQERARYRAKIGKKPALPAACDALLQQS
ncbi:MAG TPA: penicillin-insensitive murein endopeptidase [Polyangiales bacterium]